MLGFIVSFVFVATGLSFKSHENKQENRNK